MVTLPSNESDSGECNMIGDCIQPGIVCRGYMVLASNFGRIRAAYNFGHPYILYEIGGIRNYRPVPYPKTM